MVLNQEGRLSRMPWSIFLFKLFTFIQYHELPLLYTATRVIREILNIFNVFLPFVCRINLVIEDKAWGTKQEDGHFDGLMGLLEREEVNLTITAMQFMSARLDVSDFIFPSHYFK